MEYLLHQQRIIEERDSLKEKCSKLESFFNTEIYNNLDSINQGLLSDQYYHMDNYCEILNKRIELF